jgi:hypothetical protein
MQRPASGDSELIDPPTRFGHRLLEFGHEASCRLHPTGTRPQTSGEVSRHQVEQKLALQLVEAAVRRGIAVIGVQVFYERRVAFDDQTQSIVRRWDQMTTLKFPSATSEGSRK